MPTLPCIAQKHGDETALLFLKKAGVRQLARINKKSGGDDRLHFFYFSEVLSAFFFITFNNPLSSP